MWDGALLSWGWLNICLLAERIPTFWWELVTGFLILLCLHSQILLSWLNCLYLNPQVFSLLLSPIPLGQVSQWLGRAELPPGAPVSPAAFSCLWSLPELSSSRLKVLRQHKAAIFCSPPPPYFVWLQGLSSTVWRVISTSITAPSREKEMVRYPSCFTLIGGSELFN